MRSSFKYQSHVSIELWAVLLEILHVDEVQK